MFHWCSAPFACNFWVTSFLSSIHLMPQRLLETVQSFSGDYLKPFACQNCWLSNLFSGYLHLQLVGKDALANEYLYISQLLPVLMNICITRRITPRRPSWRKRQFSFPAFANFLFGSLNFFFVHLLCTLFPLNCFNCCSRRKDYGLIVGMEKDDYYKVIYVCFIFYSTSLS